MDRQQAIWLIKDHMEHHKIGEYPHILLGEALNMAIAALSPQNEPLTLEQLREMDGEPAWWDDGDGSCWGIISVDSAGMWGGMPFFRGRWREVNFEYNIEERKMKIYRRPPEGEEDT